MNLILSPAISDAIIGIELAIIEVTLALIFPSPEEEALPEIISQL
jgi:hypothetical protein